MQTRGSKKQKKTKRGKRKKKNQSGRGGFIRDQDRFFSRLSFEQKKKKEGGSDRKKTGAELVKKEDPQNR